MPASDPRCSSPAHRLRAGGLGLILAVALLAAAVLTAVVLRRAVQRAGAAPRVDVDDAVPLIALAVLAAGLTWLAVVVIAVSADLLRRARGGPVAVGEGSVRGPLAGPLAVRVSGLLLAVTALGPSGALSTAAAAPSAVAVVSTVDAAAPDGSTNGGGRRAVPVPDFDPDSGQPEGSPCPAPVPGWTGRAPFPGWTGQGPGLQRSASTDQAGLLGRCGPADRREVVVHRGDTLWGIVERDLGPGATAREVAAAWPRWYAANRGAIGSDPDVLLPGTTLHRPAQEALR